MLPGTPPGDNPHPARTWAQYSRNRFFACPTAKYQPSTLPSGNTDRTAQARPPKACLVHSGQLSLLLRRGGHFVLYRANNDGYPGGLTPRVTGSRCMPRLKDGFRLLRLYWTKLVSIALSRRPWNGHTRKRAMVGLRLRAGFLTGTGGISLERSEKHEQGKHCHSMASSIEKRRSGIRSPPEPGFSGRQEASQGEWIGPSCKGYPQEEASWLGQHGPGLRKTADWTSISGFQKRVTPWIRPSGYQLFFPVPPLGQLGSSALLSTPGFHRLSRQRSLRSPAEALPCLAPKRKQARW